MEITNNFDTKSLLGHWSNGALDMGDCSALTGRLYYLDHKPEAFDRALTLLECQPGIYWRHPSEPFNQPFDPKWSPGHDQISPLVIAMGEYPEQRERLLRLYSQQRFRNWKYQNADWATPQRVNMFNRSLGYDISLLGDWFLLADSIWIVLRGCLQPSWCDQDPNHCLAVDQATRLQATRVSKLAKSIYFNLRNVRKKLSDYFDGNPALEPLYEKVLQR